MVRDKAWEIKEKWTRPYWDVPNGYGNCTAVTNTSKDRCAFYPEEHCTLPGSVRIDAKENCNWEALTLALIGTNPNPKCPTLNLTPTLTLTLTLTVIVPMTLTMTTTLALLPSP